MSSESSSPRSANATPLLKRLRFRIRTFLAKYLPSEIDWLVPAGSENGGWLAWFSKRIVRTNPFMHAMLGPIAFAAVRSGYRLGLFTLLAAKPGADKQTVANDLSLSLHATETLLMSLASLQMIHRIDTGYYNDPFFERALAGRYADDFFPKWMDFMSELVLPASLWFEESLREDRAVGMVKLFGEVDSFYQALGRDDRLRYFDAFMKSVTAINRERVASLPQWQKFSRFLDVGGSTGSMAMALARQQPQAEVTVFDFPSVTAVAAQRFAETEERLRLHTIGGDILTEELPTGFEVIFFCHFCGVFSEEKNRENVRRAYQALETDGVLCIFTPVVNTQEDGPLSTALFSSYFTFLANGKGRFYSAERVRSWLEEAGFRQVEICSLPAYEVMVIGYK